MKYLILALLFSCSDSFDTRIKKDAESFCSCRGGVKNFFFNETNLDLFCNDSTHIGYKGNISTFFLGGCSDGN